jgi:hypothetical protein
MNERPRGRARVHRRWRRRRRDDPIVDAVGERRRDNLTAVVGPRTHERGRSKDRTVHINKRWRRRRRDNPIMDVAGERQRDNLIAVVGPRTGQAGARQGQDRAC